MKHLKNGLMAFAAVAALGSAVVAAGAAQSQSAPARVRAAPQVSARATVEAAARAMGGIEKIRAIRNITATGYGQYAYMMGGGRIDGWPGAPEKYMAANDLTRVYDLEHDRFQLTERRNMLFPFLGPFGHGFALNTQILDGDVAFDMQAGPQGGAPAARRVPRWSESPLTLEGVHIRRMWMMQNPVVLVRAMMDPATRLSAPRRVGDATVIDVTLKTGDKITAGFAANGLPQFMRFANPQSNLGQVNLTTTFSGWSAWDGQGGVLMPLGFETRSDWRNVDFFKMYVDAYKVNSAIPDLAAPAAVRNAPEPPSFAVTPPTSVPVAKGVWRINQGGTTVIEFKDYIVLYELPGNSRGQAKALIDYARSLAGNKPVRYLVTSHNHFDHTVGVREAVAEGITLIQRPSTLQQFREMAAHAAPEFPDDQERRKAPFKSLVLDEHIQLKDETQTLDIYWGRNNGHMADVVFGYLPAHKVLMEGDMVTAAYDWQHWPDSLRDVIAYYKLDVERISPVHSVWPEHPNVLTRAQAEELLSGGTKRAREHCADLLSKGNYHPGCPVQSKYY